MYTLIAPGTLNLNRPFNLMQPQTMPLGRHLYLVFLLYIHLLETCHDIMRTTVCTTNRIYYSTFSRVVRLCI